MRARMEGTGGGVVVLNVGWEQWWVGLLGVCMHVCVLREGFCGRDGKIRFIFSWGEEGGWRGVVGFSNGTSLYFIYLQMEENENVFWIGFLHAFSFCSHVLVFLSAQFCLSAFIPPEIHPSSCSPFLLADPQGYGMSGHLIRPSLDAEYVVPLIPTAHIVYPMPAIIYSSLCPLCTAHPAVINEHDLGKKVEEQWFRFLWINFLQCSLCSVGSAVLAHCHVK